MDALESPAFFSNGNLLIAGEYFVLEGATAFAVPLKFGQKMEVDNLTSERNILYWTVFELSRPRISVCFETEQFTILGQFINEGTTMLQQILRAAKSLSPGVFNGKRSYRIRCSLEFRMDWGWGSSSSLVCNLAAWTGADPFKLNNLVSPGSGYDIAASGSQTPVFFRLVDGSQNIESATFNPPFKGDILFVYTGRKQNTANSIAINRESIRKQRKLVQEISWLSKKISMEQDIREFMRYVAGHENILSKALKMRRVKELYFADFNGEIKSLGAWGGDFIMAVSPEGNEYNSQYFRSKGLQIIFRFDDIIRQNGMA